MDDDYKIPEETKIGHVHLKVSDLKRSLDFYCGVLGFELINMFGDSAAFISAGGYHHHIALNTWYSKGLPPSTRYAVGLYHTAILYPSKKDLAVAYKRLQDLNYPVLGASDHGVSQSLYLDDPDGNGIELYCDRPKEEWPRNEDGSLNMYTIPLDLEDLLKS